MQVICVREGDKYNENDVNALYKQCLDVGLNKFVCLADTDKHEPETVRLKYGYKGWWAKMELFSPELEHLRPFLFLDLDTFVMQPMNFDDLDDFYMLRDFYRPHGGQSAMMWIPKDTSEIWSAWIEQPEWHMSKHRGDQDFLELFDFKRFQDEFEGHMSYKADQLEKDNKNAITVHFHGKPKPNECTGWALDFWNKYK